MMNQHAGHLIVIGASAGGLTAVREFVAGIRADIDACVLLVLHLSETSVSNYLVAKLQNKTQLKCMLASHDTPLLRGHMYIAAPNHHLIVSKDRIKLGQGAKENRWRPSIDVLFRSAAASYSNRVIGIVLTGLLNDGTTGSSAIKRCGGTVIIQHPDEAEYPDMPLSVQNNVDVDHVLRINEMPAVIDQIINNSDSKERIMPPEDIRDEAEVEEKIVTGIEEAEKLGDNTVYTCPECGGVLFERDDDSILRLKCHTGHSFSLRDLLLKQSEEYERSLWYAIRSLEQKKSLYNSLASKYKSSGIESLTGDYKGDSQEIEKYINTLKSLLSAIHKLSEG